MSIYDVLIRPVITEKSNELQESLNQYTFEVDMRANKIQIKDAVELIFDVSVTGVRTMVVPAKRGRRGRKFYIRKQTWKKAIVTVDPKDKINLFNA
ncbi:MAG: 50S ribosomal protein L23 [Phototrophicales bacterium]|nr:MAG: 50S ribosomal protein L23 [Phototrophicales bacterium]